MSAYEYRIRGNYNLQSGNGCIPLRDSGISLSESILLTYIHTVNKQHNLDVCRNSLYVRMYVCMYVCMYACIDAYLQCSLPSWRRRHLCPRRFPAHI